MLAWEDRSSTNCRAAEEYRLTIGFGRVQAEQIIAKLLAVASSSVLVDDQDRDAHAS